MSIIYMFNLSYINELLQHLNAIHMFINFFSSSSAFTSFSLAPPIYYRGQMIDHLLRFPSVSFFFGSIQLLSLQQHKKQQPRAKGLNIEHNVLLSTR